NLLVREGEHLLAIHVNGADEFTFFEHRHRHKTSHACNFDKGNYPWVIFNIGLVNAEIRYMHNFLGCAETTEWGYRIVFYVNDAVAMPILNVTFIVVVESHPSKLDSVVQIQCSNGGSANASCIGQHRVEHRLQLAGRA